MPALPPALIAIAVPAVAVCLYALIWYATRELSGGARALARTVPLAVIAPVLVVVAIVVSVQREEAEAEAAPFPRVGRTGAWPSRLDTAPADRTSPAPAAPAFRAFEPTAAPKVRADAGDAPAAPAAGPPPPGDWDVVPVFYGTDRVRQEAGSRVIYGPERARRLELGRALVTVPAAHRVPSIERPFALRVPYFQVVLYAQGEDPQRHFTVKELSPLPADSFLAQARTRIAAARAFKDQAFVFVHGFNTAFDDALYRAAQLAYDLQFDGAAFVYSWPSAGGVIGYAHDRESATQAEPYLKAFLTMVLERTGARSVSVIAHSMGTLPLLEALRELGPALPPGVRLNEVILAAPDIDRDVFANIAAGIRRYGHGITLYCSSNDRAMTVSRRFAGGVPRAGDVPADGPVIVPGIDTIDVTETSTDLLALNHSLYAEKGALLNDIGLLLQTGERPPEQRVPILQRVSTRRGDFWRYP